MIPKLRIPSPRLLPCTIIALAALMGVKSVALVRAAGLTGNPASAEPHVVRMAEAATPHGAASSAPKPSVEKPPPAPATSSDAAPKPSAPPDPPVSESERALLLDLRARRAALDAREAGLTTRENVLDAAEKKLAARVQELDALQTKLEQLEAGRKARDEANWRGLVKLYEDMKPRDAAAIFDDLDLQVLLQVLDRMAERKAAPILAAMQPERARQVTARLAQMRTRQNTPGG